MNPDVSVIVVNHLSATESLGCVASLREAFAHERLAGEIVLVDCGSGPGETRELERIPADTRVLLPDNRGYSGGVNAGVLKARGARLILSNADVLYLPGAVSALLSEIEEGSVGAAAPLCLWDEAGRLRLPADASLGFLGEIAELHAGALEALDTRRFAAFARRAERLWRDGGDAMHLVGAVLAVRREVFERVGGFDERFLFEYEETEWEERVRRAGLRLRFAPRARVRHLFARSATRNPETERRRGISRRLYRLERYGRLGRAILERHPRRRRPPRATVLAEPVIAARAGAALAVSTNPSLIPFAGASLEEDFRLPEEVLASLSAGPIYLRIFRLADGWPLETFVWEKR